MPIKVVVIRRVLCSLQKNDLEAVLSFDPVSIPGEENSVLDILEKNPLSNKKRKGRESVTCLSNIKPKSE